MIMSFQKISNSLVICSSLMHIFCCGIPLILSITSLGAMLGISGAEYFEFEWYESIEDKVLIFSGAILAITAAFRIYGKVKCAEQEVCCDEISCEENRDISGLVFKVAVILYAINLLIVFAS